MRWNPRTHALIFAVFAFALIADLRVVCAAEQEFESGISATWWNAHGEATGTQLSIPVKVQATAEGFKAVVMNALVRTSMDPDDGSRISMGGFVDTKADLSCQVNDLASFDVLVGVGLNLPTGMTGLDADEVQLSSLPAELLPISTFGEGFNVNPYLVAARQFDGLTAGFGMGYLRRGEYDYSETFKNLDPGDIFTASARIENDCTETLRGKIFAEYAGYGKDTLDGDDYYREGDLFTLGAGFTLTQPSWNMDCQASYTFRGKARFYTPTYSSLPSEKNFGDELRLDVTHAFFLDSRTSWVSRAGLLVTSENDYGKDTGLRNEGRTKIEIGTGMRKKVSDSFSARVEAAFFSLTDKANWYHPEEEITYRGLTIAAGGVWTF